MRFVGIDPATVTGFVALDINGNVLEERDVGKKGKGGITIDQLVSLENDVYRLLKPGDEIVIEGTPFDTQKAITAGMIHGGIRTMIVRKGMSFNEASPNSVKKFVAHTGWTGEVGSKKRLKGEAAKRAVAADVLKHFGYSHKSHNVTDAYIIARIALNVYLYRELMPTLDNLPYQLEVVQTILEGKGDE